MSVIPTGINIKHDPVGPQGNIDSSEPIEPFKVFIRIRPLNEKEKNFIPPSQKSSLLRNLPVNQSNQYNQLNSNKGILLAEDNLLFVLDPDSLDYNGRKEKSFVFDNIFTERHCNYDIFDNVIKTMIENVIKGYNATALAYGVTGTGKTHTMFGNVNQIYEENYGNNFENNFLEENLDQISSPYTEKGVCVYALDYLFDLINFNAETKSFTVKISYLEIYNEQVIDLLTLNDKPSPLMIVEDSAKGVVVPDLSEYIVTNSRELLKLIIQGNSKRTMAATNQNQFSSRSHAILQIVIEQKNKIRDTKEEFLISKFLIVDLAGSERGGLEKGLRTQEGANINKSLLSLGNCINILSDKSKKGAFVPYRDSKLTRLLKDSLGGNICTVMIACVSPSQINYDETVNTLKYATRARTIQKKISKNMKEVDVHISQYKEIIDSLKSEIDALKEIIKTQQNIIEKRIAANQEDNNVENKGEKIEYNNIYNNTNMNTSIKEDNKGNNTVRNRSGNRLNDKDSNTPNNLILNIPNPNISLRSNTRLGSVTVSTNSRYRDTSLGNKKDNNQNNASNINANNSVLSYNNYNNTPITSVNRSVHTTHNARSSNPYGPRDIKTFSSNVVNNASPSPNILSRSSHINNHLDHNYFKKNSGRSVHGVNTDVYRKILSDMNYNNVENIIINEDDTAQGNFPINTTNNSINESNFNNMNNNTSFKIDLERQIDNLQNDKQILEDYLEKSKYVDKSINDKYNLIKLFHQKYLELINDKLIENIEQNMILKFNMKEILDLNNTNNQHMNILYSQLNHLENSKKNNNGEHDNMVENNTIDSSSKSVVNAVNNSDDEIIKIKEEMKNIADAIDENERIKEKIADSLKRNLRIKKVLKKILVKLISNSGNRERDFTRDRENSSNNNNRKNETSSNYRNNLASNSYGNAYLNTNSNIMNNLTSNISTNKAYQTLVKEKEDLEIKNVKIQKQMGEIMKEKKMKDSKLNDVVRELEVLKRELREKDKKIKEIETVNRNLLTATGTVGNADDYGCENVTTNTFRTDTENNVEANLQDEYYNRNIKKKFINDINTGKRNNEAYSNNNLHDSNNVQNIRYIINQTNNIVNNNINKIINKEKGRVNSSNISSGNNIPNNINIRKSFVGGNTNINHNINQNITPLNDSNKLLTRKGSNRSIKSKHSVATAPVRSKRLTTISTTNHGNIIHHAHVDINRALSPSPPNKVKTGKLRDFDKIIESQLNEVYNKKAKELGDRMKRRITSVNGMSSSNYPNRKEIHNIHSISGTNISNVKSPANKYTGINSSNIPKDKDKEKFNNFNLILDKFNKMIEANPNSNINIYPNNKIDKNEMKFNKDFGGNNIINANNINNANNRSLSISCVSINNEADAEFNSELDIAENININIQNTSNALASKNNKLDNNSNTPNSIKEKAISTSFNKPSVNTGFNRFNIANTKAFINVNPNTSNAINNNKYSDFNLNLNAINSSRQSALTPPIKCSDRNNLNNFDNLDQVNTDTIETHNSEKRNSGTFIQKFLNTNNSNNPVGNAAGMVFLNNASHIPREKDRPVPVIPHKRDFSPAAFGSLKQARLEKQMKNIQSVPHNNGSDIDTNFNTNLNTNNLNTNMNTNAVNQFTSLNNAVNSTNSHNFTNVNKFLSKNAIDFLNDYKKGHTNNSSALGAAEGEGENVGDLGDEALGYDREEINNGKSKENEKFVPADGNFNVGEIKVQSGSKDKGSNKKGETLNSDMKDITPSRDEMLYENTNTFNDMSESNIVDFRGVAITDFDNIEINGVKDKETIDVNTNDGLNSNLYPNTNTNTNYGSFTITPTNEDIFKSLSDIKNPKISKFLDKK
jgi:hypothetical protein